MFLSVILFSNCHIFKPLKCVRWRRLKPVVRWPLGSSVDDVESVGHSRFVGTVRLTLVNHLPVNKDQISCLNNPWNFNAPFCFSFYKAFKLCPCKLVRHFLDFTGLNWSLLLWAPLDWMKFQSNNFSCRLLPRINGTLREEWRVRHFFLIFYTSLQLSQDLTDKTYLACMELQSNPPF